MADIEDHPAFLRGRQRLHGVQLGSDIDIIGDDHVRQRPAIVKSHQGSDNRASVSHEFIPQAGRLADLAPDVLDRHGELAVEDQPECAVTAVGSDQDHGPAKLGSTSVGEAISSFPWSDSMMTQRRLEIVIPHMSIPRGCPCGLMRSASWTPHAHETMRKGDCREPSGDSGAGLVCCSIAGTGRLRWRSPSPGQLGDVTMYA